MFNKVIKINKHPDEFKIHKYDKLYRFNYGRKHVALLIEDSQGNKHIQYNLKGLLQNCTLYNIKIVESFDYVVQKPITQKLKLPNYNTNIKELFEYIHSNQILKDPFRFRHTVLVKVCCALLHLEYIEDVKYGKYTPDIVSFIQGDTLSLEEVKDSVPFIIEITCTKSPSIASLNKYQKYKNLQDNAFFYILSFTDDLSNFYTELNTLPFDIEFSSRIKDAITQFMMVLDSNSELFKKQPDPFIKPITFYHKNFLEFKEHYSDDFDEKEFFSDIDLFREKDFNEDVRSLFKTQLTLASNFKYKPKKSIYFCLPRDFELIHGENSEQKAIGDFINQVSEFRFEGLKIFEGFKSEKIQFIPKNFKRSSIFEKAGVKARSKEMHLDQLHRTSTLGDIGSVNNFLKILMEECKQPLNLDLFHVGPDQNFQYFLKNEFKKEYTSYWDMIKNLFVIRHSYYIHLCADQAIHFAGMKKNNKQMAVYTAGVSNVLNIQILSSQGLTQEAGPPICQFILTSDRQHFDENPLFRSKILGQIGNKWLVFVRWFRLPIHRLEHLYNHFWALLTTTFSQMSRNPTFLQYPINFIPTKFLFSVSCSESLHTKLADIRYTVFSSMAIKTDFEELISEKFCAPYPTVVEVWMINKISDWLPKMRSEILSGNIKFYTPVLDMLGNFEKRTLGGQFRLSSLWTNFQIKNIQDFFDEVFVYVLNPKDPSSVYHQEVNAIKTILKYQQIFEKKTIKEQHGIGDWNSPVGFDQGFLRNACRWFFSSRQLNFKTAESSCEATTILDVLNTKAVIPNDRNETKKEKDEQKNSMKITKSAYVKMKLFHGADISEDMIINKADYRPSGRKKVFDEIYETVKFEDEYPTIGNLTSDLINKQFVPKVDICIKAQYGGKREFYVMSFGAKIIARYVEDFFKNLCEQVPEECISRPGDKKMFYMLDIVKSSYQNSLRHKKNLIYTNGDCTKWSACETLQAFMVIVDELRPFINSIIYEKLMSVLAMWSDKQICVPFDIKEKTFPYLDCTDYLEEDYIHSTQNFLQGCFNYLSSFKFCIISEYSKYLYSKVAKEVNYKLSFFCHSDDYAWTGSFTNLENYYQFRSINRKCMKMGGIIDSNKKTNTQLYMFEFVSLYSFNGTLHYPQIKKMKEVNNLLPNEDFESDQLMVCGRTAECLRIGCSMSQSWMFHQIHIYQLYKYYSLLKGMRNEVVDPLLKPISLLGRSDMLPIYYLFSTGDPNNYRLYNLRKEFPEIERYLSFQIDLHFKNHEITLHFKRYSKRLNKIRKKLKYNIEDMNTFFTSHPSYLYTKPDITEHIEEWLVSKYFQKSFCKAYYKESSATRLLRASHFVSGSVVSIQDVNFFDIDTHDLITLSQLNSLITESNFISDRLDDQNFMFKYLMGNDTTSYSLNSWFECCKDTYIKKRRFFSPNCRFLPKKIDWMELGDYNLKVFFQICDPKRMIHEPDRDYVEQLCEILNRNTNIVNEFNRIKSESNILTATSFLYKALVNKNSQSTRVILSDAQGYSLFDFFRDFVKKQTFTEHTLDFIMIAQYKELNPFTMVEEFVDPTGRRNEDYVPVLRDITLLQLFLLYSYDQNVDFIKKTNILFENNWISIKDFISGIRNKFSSLNLRDKKSLAYFDLLLNENPDLCLKLESESGLCSYKFEKIKGNWKTFQYDEVCFLKFAMIDFMILANNDSCIVITPVKAASYVSLVVEIVKKMYGNKFGKYCESVCEHVDIIMNRVIFTNCKTDDSSIPYYIDSTLKFPKFMKARNIGVVYDIVGHKVMTGELKFLNLPYYKGMWSNTVMSLGDNYIDLLITSGLLGFYTESSSSFDNYCEALNEISKDSRNIISQAYSSFNEFKSLDIVKERLKLNHQEEKKIEPIMQSLDLDFGMDLEIELIDGDDDLDHFEDFDWEEQPEITSLNTDDYTGNYINPIHLRDLNINVEVDFMQPSHLQHYFKSRKKPIVFFINKLSEYMDKVDAGFAAFLIQIDFKYKNLLTEIFDLDLPYSEKDLDCVTYNDMAIWVNPIPATEKNKRFLEHTVLKNISYFSHKQQKVYVPYQGHKESMHSFFLERTNFWGELKNLCDKHIFEYEERRKIESLNEVSIEDFEL